VHRSSYLLPQPGTSGFKPQVLLSNSQLKSSDENHDKADKGDDCSAPFPLIVPPPTHHPQGPQPALRREVTRLQRRTQLDSDEPSFLTSRSRRAGMSPPSHSKRTGRRTRLNVVSDPATSPLTVSVGVSQQHHESKFPIRWLAAMRPSGSKWSSDEASQDGGDGLSTVAAGAVDDDLLATTTWSLPALLAVRSA